MSPSDPHMLPCHGDVLRLTIMGVVQHNYKVSIVHILAPGLLISALVDAVPGLA